jgi:hypothetical protein
VARARIRQGAVVDPEQVRWAEPELAFQRAVCNLLKVRGWLYFHDYDSRKNARGFPDLIAVRRQRLLFVELKSADGKVTDDQADWLYRLGALGSAEVEAHVWRPADWPTIERLLA